MPDMQYMLDNYSTSDIRKMCSSFRTRAPRERVNLSPSILLGVPKLDALNHAR